MVTGLGPLNLKDPKNIKLNSELGSSASARTSLTTTASKTRSSGTAARILVNSSQGVSSGSIFFTKAVRRPSVSSYQSAAGISRALNNGRQNYRYLSGIAATGVAAQSTTYVQSQSTASSVGEALGALAGLVTAGASAYKTLNEAGIFNKSSNKTQSNTQTNSQKLQSQVEQLSNYNPANVPAPSQEVQGYINSMTSCNDPASLKTAITVANGEVAALDSATSIYQDAVDQAQSDEAKLTSQLQGCVAQTNTAQNQVSTAKNGVNAAEIGVKQATDQLKGINAEYGQAVEGYNTAHNNYVDAQNNTKRADANEKDTSNKYEEAKSNTASAKTSCQAAEQAWQSCPDKITGPNGTQIPNPQKAQLKAKFDIAKEKLKQAEQQESNAKIAHNKAKAELDSAKQKESSAKTNEDKALQNKNKAYEKLGDQKEKVDAQETKVKQQQQLLDKQKANLETCQEAVDVANNNLAVIGEKIEGCNSYKQMLDQHNSSLSQLKDSIASQQQRLGTLEKNAANPKPQGAHSSGTFNSSETRKQEDEAKNEQIKEFRTRYKNASNLAARSRVEQDARAHGIDLSKIVNED